MKKSLRLAIIGVLALTAGVSLSNNSYAAGIVEDTKDAYNNIGVNVKKASIGANDKVDVSRTFVQYGSEGSRSFIRFATAISGPVKSIKYVRTVAGLGTKEKEVTTVYKGIQAAGGVYYYDGSQVVTTASELTNNYYWACYTIEFTTDTYKAADITAYVVVETEEEGAEVIESTPRTESYEDLKNEADNTLYINTVEELKAFRDDVNSGNNYKGKKVELASNIDLANENWTPIGAYQKEFQGSFNGNGYTVSNLKIDDLEVFGAGLFGYAINASFANVNMHNVNIRADQEVGTICGSAKTSTFDNIHVTGELDLYADYGYAAGIVSQGYVKISNCSVLPEGTGSIVVREKTMAGGIVGWMGEGNSYVENCHVKNLEITAWTSLGAITGLLHYDNVMNNCSAENVVLTKTRDGGSPAIGAACGNWVAKANSAEYLTKITNSSFKNIELNGNSAITDAQQVCDYSSLYGAPYNANTMQEKFKAEIKNVSVENIVDNVDRGTSTKVHYIYNLADLKAFRDAVNAGNGYKGQTIVLANNIDLNNEEWYPIGYDEYFEGNFDGNGHTVSNLKVNIDFGAGFISFPKGATIKNLNLHNVNNYADQQVGTIAGWCNEDTIIDNCHVTGTVNLESKTAYVGGIASDGDVSITNCSIKAEGTGVLKAATSTTAGGIIANLSYGNTIANCYVENLDISATKIVGGIVGQLYPTTTLDNCEVKNVTLNKTATTGLPSIGLACGAWVDLDSNPATAITNCTFDNVELNGQAVIASQYAGCDFNVVYGSPYGGLTFAFNVDLTNTTFTNIVDNVERSANGSVLYIRTVEELKAFRDEVNAGNKYQGKTVKLLADIDLANENWTPIGNSTNSFNGTFDGNTHKISNLYVNVAGGRDLGFFGFTQNGEVKNLVVENASVSGRLNVAVVAGTPYTTKYTNITIQGHIEVNGLAYVGGLGGKNGYADVTNVTINADETSYIKADSRENGNAYRTYVGGVIGFMGEGNHTLTNVKSNIDVIGSTCDAGGIVGIAHYGNNFVNCSSSGDVTLTNSEDGVQYEIGGIAGVWHNETGYVVTFTNCSYTGTLSSTYYVEDNALTVENFKHNDLVGSAYNSTVAGILIIDGVEYTA